MVCSTCDPKFGLRRTATQNGQREEKSRSVTQRTADITDPYLKKTDCPEFSKRSDAKGSKRLLSKTSKPVSSTISSPPKAAVLAPNAKKDEVHRRRNPLNDILRRRSGDDAIARDDRPRSSQDVEIGNSVQSSNEVVGVDARMGERVAELERSLAIAREEQKLMREELDNVRLQSDPRRGTGSEHSRQADHEHQITPDAFDGTPLNRMKSTDVHEVELDEKEDLKAPEISTNHQVNDQSVDDVMRQNYDLRYKVAQLQDQLASQDITYNRNLNQIRPHGDAAWNELRMRLHATEKESQDRLQQLLLLKSSISSLTRVESHITDSELAESFTQLFNRVREWTISNYRRTKFEIEHIPLGTVRALKSLAPAYTSIEKSDRLALYQALVASALTPVLQEPLVVGLPVSDALAGIRSFAESIENVGSEYGEWRRATVRAIAGSKFSAPLEQSKNDVLHKIAGEIAHMLFTITAVNLTPAAQSTLMGILHTAVELQRTMILQKARYRVSFFRNQEGGKSCAFDECKMESVNDIDSAMEDEDVSIDRYFSFCVFPCLEKYGDEWGENMEVSNVLLKARVCIRA